MGKSGKAPDYASTTSSNPYATGTASDSGSSYKLNDFLTNTNNTIESTMPTLLNQLTNPSLDNPVTKARSDLFNKTFNENSTKAFENNIINPLSSRNMMRSSATDALSKKFAEDQNDQISTFNNQLISNNASDTSSMINQLVSLYMNGANLGQQAIQNAKGDAQMVNAFGQSNFAQESANNNAMWSNLANIGSTLGKAGIMASDIRVKENIKKIGEKNGYNWYEFNYKNGFGLPEGKQEGVIAQEVEKINPDAVQEINGIKHVDYSKIEV